MNRPSRLESAVVTLMMFGMLAIAVGAGFAWGYLAALAVTL